ncbi:RE2 [Symbiodinium natans]|uniref:RE2 protein n=1 Tax=Symbiodinium natans TaxID=878477 RepID=A0A812S619_9DINO|nr:RE2 [Symbiodinium natans]
MSFPDAGDGDPLPGFDGAQGPGGDVPVNEPVDSSGRTSDTGPASRDGDDVVWTSWNEDGDWEQRGWSRDMWSWTHWEESRDRRGDWREVDGERRASMTSTGLSGTGDSRTTGPAGRNPGLWTMPGDPWSDGRGHGGGQSDPWMAYRTSWPGQVLPGQVGLPHEVPGGPGPPLPPSADGRAWVPPGDDSHLRPRVERDEGAVWNGWRHFGDGGYYQDNSDGRNGGLKNAGHTRPTERLTAPSFSGDGEDVGSSARSYLRQIEAWRRMTLVPLHQQGLVLYQGLSGGAWVAAEELNVDELGKATGVQYLVSWVTARYLDLEITRIGRAFSEFFRKLKRKHGQSIREYNTEYDRLYARLKEIGCTLPEACAAWLYVDRLQLEEHAELNLLASVGNKYALLPLQQAAVIHDRGHRKPWENAKRKPYINHLTDAQDDEEEAHSDEEDLADGVPEEVATAYMAYQSAKNRYKDQARNRGYHGPKGEESGGGGGNGHDKDSKGVKDAKIKSMKAKSFCAGCGRRGHWHRDPECPHNRGRDDDKHPKGAAVKEIEMCSVMPADVFVVKYEGDQLHGITDTACARTVTGTQWLQRYLDIAGKDGNSPQLHRECEAFRFGTGKIYYSSFYVILTFTFGNKLVQVRTSVITGDIPLLLSKTVLGKLGMLYDVEGGKADFTKVGIQNYRLATTPSGHPAILIVPAPPPISGGADLLAEDLRLEPLAAYMAFAVSCRSPMGASSPSQLYGFFHDKKLDPSVRNMLAHEKFEHHTFYAWWLGTSIAGDFWVETFDSWIRWLEPTVDVIGASEADRQCPLPPQSMRPAISKMGKVQLLEEALRLGLVVHRSWSVEEIKSAIMEHTAQEDQNDPTMMMKRMGNMTLAELKLKATSLGVEYNERVTKGNLLRLVRDHVGTEDTELMKVGRFRGYEFREVPTSYATWVAQEYKRADTMDPDLVRFLRWHENKEKQKKETYSGGLTDNGYSTTPYIPSYDTADSQSQYHSYQSHRSSAGSSWGVVDTPDASRSPKKRATGEVNPEIMDPEPDPSTMAEIQALEAKLEREVITSDERRAGREGCGGCAGDRPDDLITEEEFLSRYKTHHSYLVQDLEDDIHSAATPVEDAAQEAYKRGDFSHERCLQVLRLLPHEPQKVLRGKGFAVNEGENDGGSLQSGYSSYGLFVHGGTHGVTVASQDHGHLTRYINAYGRHHLEKGATWSTFTLSVNVQSKLHHDAHNLRGSQNHCISLGQDSGGGVWVQHRDLSEREANTAEVVWKRGGNGSWIPGHIVNTKNNFYSFDPHLKHSTEEWGGNRWCLIFHTARSINKVGDEVRDYLKRLGFRLPRRDPEQQEEGHRVGKLKPNRGMRSRLSGIAGKLSVLYTTLLIASTSFLSEVYSPGPTYDPIVLFEIGGFDHTMEATDLNKTVLEPLSWTSYNAPEGKELAHNFIIGASPQELCVHTGDMPEGCEQDVLDLAREQLEGGGSVIVEDDKVGRFVDYLTKYLQYYDEAKQRAVFFREKAGRRRWDGEKRAHQVCVLDEIGGKPDEDAKKDIKLQAGGIRFDPSVSETIRGPLRRLHQNLGHPRREDLLRHLRLAGCENAVLKAVKGMTCEVCDSQKGPNIARPSALPRMYGFNDCVGGDILYAHDVNDEKHIFLNLVDWGTTFQVVVKIPGTKAEDLEKAFNDHWITPFGPPVTVSLDLEGGLQKGLARLCDWHHIKAKHAAAQAHWQAGVTERHGAWWKNIWDRVVHDRSVGSEEAELAATCVSSAKNELRRRCGHAPVTWVFGRNPRGLEDYIDPDSGEKLTWSLSGDSQYQRLVTMRASARIAFHQSQNDDRLRRALLQRARTVSRPYEPGEPVHFWFQPKNRRRARWEGPAVVVGREGNNYWISRNGRCRLTAPEHLRPSGPEEVGELMTMKYVEKEMNALLEADLDHDDTFDQDKFVLDYDRELDDATGERGGLYDEEEMMDYEPDIDEEEDLGGGVRLEEAIDEPMAARPPSRRFKRKGPPEDAVCEKGERAHEAMAVRRQLTQRGVAKRQEKELKWHEIPDEVKEKFRHAERQQWEEHLAFDALEPMSVDESHWVRQNVNKERVLRCRWAYRDKNWSKRKGGSSEIEWKCKSRLVIAGHTDPDLGTSAGLSTDAPTLSRAGFLTLMQILANGRKDKDPWRASAGDIRCAFLTGSYLKREEELFLHQPDTGFPGLDPRQLVRVKKNIFGLATSPHEWWGDLQAGIKGIELRHDGKVYGFDQCPLDPCIFVLREKIDGGFRGAGIGFVGSHVDDLLVIAPSTFGELIKKELSAAFPVDVWEDDEFSYVGMELKCDEFGVSVTQTSYVDSRLFHVTVPKGVKDEDIADQECVADNRSLVGALSWVSAQTRADLTCSVSMAQQAQARPTYGDIKFTNVVSTRATQHRDQGLRFRGVPRDDILFLIYHDAGWANAHYEDDDPNFKLYDEDNQAGVQHELPPSLKGTRKAKKENSKVASQLGCLIMIAERGCVGKKGGIANVVDWKSRAGQRVCRSTFGAEAQAAAEGLEAGQYMRSLYETLIAGELVGVDQAVFPLLCVSDCRSLFDHLHREGVPRTPSDRRLAVDLAALRLGLRSEQWGAKLPFGWIPTHLQMSDILTKPQDSAAWWDSLGGPLLLPINVAGEDGRIRNRNVTRRGASVKPKDGISIVSPEGIFHHEYFTINTAPQMPETP